jgi:hypothetical protein
VGGAARRSPPAAAWMNGGPVDHGAGDVPGPGDDRRIRGDRPE